MNVERREIVGNTSGVTEVKESEQVSQTRKVMVKEKQTEHNRENKINSLNQGALNELEGSIYLIKKGYTVVLTIEQKKSRQMLQRFRTCKLYDSNGYEIFDNKNVYEVISTADGKKELKTDERGYPIKMSEEAHEEFAQKQRDKRERRSATNDIVILHIVYNIMLHNETNAEYHLVRLGTKPSTENKVSKFRLKRVPCVNDEGITESYIGSSLWRRKQTEIMHEIVSDCFTNQGLPSLPTNERRKGTSSHVKYVCIGDGYHYFFDTLPDEMKASCLCISRTHFLQMMKQGELPEKQESNDIPQEVNQQMNAEMIMTQNEEQMYQQVEPCENYMSHFNGAMTMNSFPVQQQEMGIDQYQMMTPMQMNMMIMNPEGYQLDQQCYSDQMTSCIASKIEVQNTEYSFNQQVNDVTSQQLNGNGTIEMTQQQPTVTQEMFTTNENQQEEMNTMGLQYQFTPNGIENMCQGIILMNNQMGMPITLPFDGQCYYVPVCYVNDFTSQTYVPVTLMSTSTQVTPMNQNTYQ